MTSSQLVPVSPGTIGNVQCLTVDGRALHGALGVRRDFSNWMKGRITKYEFSQGQDFEVYAKIGANSEGGRPSQEYTLSVGMGKELCMVENNEKGRIARRYFIECERRLLAARPAPPETTTPSTAAGRKPLRSFVFAWSQAAGTHVSALWPQVKAPFQLARIDDLPVEWIPDALAFVQGKIDALPKALPEPPAEPKDPNVLPIRVSFLRTRDFKNAHLKADQVSRVVFNEVCRFSKKMYDLAKELDNAFGPTPNECRGETHFDAVIRFHNNAMKSFAEGVMRNAGAFADQCNALEALARMLVQSDHGTMYDSVRKLRVVMQDGTGRIFP